MIGLGIAHLIPLDQSPSRPTLEEVETNTQRRLERIRRADEAATKERHKQAAIAKKAFANAGEEAQRKREARRKAKEEKRTKLANESGILDDFSEAQPRPPVDVLDVKTEKASSKDEQPISSPLAQYNHFHVVPSLPVIPSRLPTSPRITSLPHPIFPFPSGPRDRALVATFTALHAGGHMIGLGPRFGGEYLVYPGDYLRYHAHFTTQVLVRDECIKPTELVAWGRLGTGTKKAGLLCCWDDGRRNTGNQSRDEDTPGSASGQKDGEVEFYSLEWANFG